MKLYYVRSQADYEALKGEGWKQHFQATRRLVPQQDEEFFIKGFSLVANEAVDFKVRCIPGKFPEVNWRERVLCPVTKLNNRMRFSAAIVDFLGQALSTDRLYIMEQTTRLYRYLKERHPNLIGSEFVDSSLQSGSLLDTGVLHQDATKLSFSDDSFQAVMSFDVLEHIPNYHKALSEAWRVLRPGGRFIFSAPFINAEQTLIRASINANGSVEHHCEPEYHGDPMSSEGVLCYQHFGWDILNALIDTGFRDAYGVVGWSINLGFITPQLVFVAEKS